jgi:hypothetical protein
MSKLLDLNELEPTESQVIDGINATTLEVQIPVVIDATAAVQFPLSADIALAVDALSLLDKDGSPTPICELAVKLNIKPGFLYRIMKRLELAEIVLINRGSKGGVRVIKEPVSVKDVYRALKKCHLGLNMGRRSNQIAYHLLNALGAVSIWE